jgi:hypothetical protein
MNLRNYIKILSTSLVLFAALATGWSQGVVYSNRNVFLGQSQTFNSPTGAQTATLTLSPKHGTITFNGTNAIYTPPTFACLDTFRINYYINSGGLKYYYFTSYAVKVNHSFLELNPDYAFTNKNQFVNVDVLANDLSRISSTSTSSVYLNSISLVNNGDAIIVNDQIKFTPTTGFVGLAYVNYVACDIAFGNCKSGTVSIKVNETPQSTSTSAQVSTSKNTPIAILTPSDDFNVSANAANGTVTLIENNAFKYAPNATFTGQDNITFVNASLGLTHTVIVDVINKVSNNQFAVNDLFNTAINTPITFDVLKNDRAVQPLVAGYVDQTLNNKGTIVHNGNGKFTFTPKNNWSGIAKFTYNLKNVGGSPSPNNIDEWATVNIVVSNHYPGKQIYELKTPLNTPLVLNYTIPIGGWEFSIVDNAQHGNLTYHSGQTTLNINGQSAVSGNNLMVYTPTQGFTGTDEFELLYCINGNCRNVKCYVNVEPVTPTLPQYCVGDCVWAGDTNNDGIVDIVDLLPIGYCQGETGFGRPNPSLGWYGQFANNWQQPLMPGINMKYIDTDGDGEVNGTDLTALDTHYGKTHNITPEKIINFKQIPLSFQVLTPNPQIGDLVEVDVLMGNTGNPATDMNGFTMEFPFDSNVINYQSFQMSFYPNSWMTYNAATLSLAKKHSGNQVDFGLVRAGGSAASGIGKVAKMSFIIDDDLSGIRDEDGYYTASLQMKGGKTIGSDGIMYDIEPQVIPIKINLNKGRTGFDATKVITYPNPASNEVNIYVNGGYEMSEYQVYNLAGQQLAKVNANGKSAQINVANLQNGIYFVKVITDGGVITKKIEVIK